jgi:hypothetical protein
MTQVSDVAPGPLVCDNLSWFHEIIWFDEMAILTWPDKLCCLKIIWMADIWHHNALTNTAIFISFCLQRGILCCFLAHLSWKLKWAFLNAFWPSSVCPSVRLSVRLLHFQFLLQNCWANFNQSWQKLSLGKEDLELYKWRTPPSPRGYNSERVKIYWIFF